MKKKIMILAFAMTLLISSIIIVSAQNTQTTVSYNVNPTYEVTIPTNANVPFNITEYHFGKIVVEKAILGENKCIQVTMDSQGFLQNLSDASAKIPYRILDGENLFTEQQYTKAGEETDLVIAITQDDWNQAAGGAYNATIMFTISYVDKE